VREEREAERQRVWVCERGGGEMQRLCDAHTQCEHGDEHRASSQTRCIAFLSCA
jgi:hypothetical protein